MTPIREACEVYHLGLVTVLLWMIRAWLVMLWPALVKIVREGRLNSTVLTVLGMGFIYIGHSGDNLFWGVTWRLRYWGLDSISQVLIEHGTLVNIWFRCSTGIAAVFCHLLAEDFRRMELGNRYPGNASRALKQAILIGLVGAAIDVFMRHWYFA